MKQITVSDIKPVSLSIGLRDDGQIGLSVSYVRLGEDGEPLEGYMGRLDLQLEGGMKQKALNFLKNSIKPFIREMEELT